MGNTHVERVAALRAVLASDDHRLCAYIIPEADPHLSEYLPICWQRRAWLTGFDGSAGDAVVTSHTARLWTDSRYWLQAQSSLQGTGVELMRAGSPGVPAVTEFLATLGPGAAVGIDPRLISASAFHDMADRLGRAGVRLVRVSENLVDKVWADRPSMPASTVTAHPLPLAGVAVGEKLAALRAAMARAGAGAHVVGALDAVAWLTNLRGADVSYNPVFIAWLLVTDSDATLFTDTARLSRDALSTLHGAVGTAGYHEFEPHLRRAAAAGVKFWIDEDATSAWVAATVTDAGGVIAERSRSPVTLAKARKNSAEIAGMRAAHLRDGVAMARFLHWLDTEGAHAGLDEVGVAERLAEFRAAGQGWIGPSFASIVGYAGNGAIVHYRPSRPSAARIGSDALLLIDSGAQYTDGTTDITRTVHLGSPTPDQRLRFTLVLKGHIALARQRFPAGTRGAQLDTLARAALWNAGLDYGHGTGHGVGARLSVHEWPPNISTRPAAAAVLEPGMIFSNEPGVYTEGRDGVRIENLMLVVDDTTGTPDDAATPASRGSRWLRLESLTLAPIQTSLIEPSLLTADERDWLNTYHARVREALSPMLDASARDWLIRATGPIA